MGKAWDIKRPEKVRPIQFMRTDVIVMELIQRGVTIKDLFAMYYQAEEGVELLIAEDVELAGLGSTQWPKRKKKETHGKA